MNLKNLPFPIYGNTAYRGPCPVEAVEQASFFSRLRREYPDTYGRIAVHPRNEGLKVGRQFASVIKHNSEGMTKGASDIIIPGNPTLVIELKRMNPQKSKWEDDQIAYLTAAQDAGAFVCVALGAVAAWAAFEDWRRGA